MENPDRWVQKKTLGLALGGGGSRAICHLGVLKALEDAGIRVDYISGNSMGGVIGAAYSVGNGVDDAREKVCGAFCGGGLIKPRKGDGLERAPGFFQHMKRNLRALCISLVLSFRRGFMRKNSCAKAVPGILEDISFEDLKIPFGVVALNLTDGKLDFITSGPLRDPVIAGTSIGIVFAPYEVNGKEYIDAAPVCSVPAPQARGMGADVVLAVDIRNPIPENYKVLNGFDTIFRLEMVQSNLINQAQAETADILLQPPVEPMFWGDFSHNDEVIEVGRTAMQEQIEQLKELLS